MKYMIEVERIQVQMVEVEADDLDEAFKTVNDVRFEFDKDSWDITEWIILAPLDGDGEYDLDFGEWIEL